MKTEASNIYILINLKLHSTFVPTKCLRRTFVSSRGEGYAARMAEAMSWLTLFNCWI